MADHILVLGGTRSVKTALAERIALRSSTSPAYLDVMGMTVATGRWLNKTDILDTNNICVLGAAVKERLFPLQDPLGRPIRASGDRFVVTGVLEKLGRRSGGIGGPNVLRELLAVVDGKFFCTSALLHEVQEFLSARLDDSNGLVKRPSGNYGIGDRQLEG